MKNAIIGSSGFVGSTLVRQGNFEGLYRSTNIAEIADQAFDTVVCAAAPAQKWIANREPQADLQKIQALIGWLKTFSCRKLVLISTVDVFKNPVGVDEDSPVEEGDLQPYGLHRRLLERFVEAEFSNHLIVRLPGLVGPGLRKNVIFDFLNGNNLQAIDSRGVFQFYPTINLWYDLQIADRAGLKLLHLTAEPISVAQVSQAGFGRPFDQPLSAPTATYDLRSKHATLFGGRGSYQYSERESVQAIRADAQSEPLTLRTAEGH